MGKQLRDHHAEWSGLLLAFRTQPYGRGRRNLDAEWTAGSAGQVGKVEDATSGTDLGPDAVVGFGIGASVDLPIGPLQIEWGTCSAGRDRLDIILGTPF